MTDVSQNATSASVPPVVSGALESDLGNAADAIDCILLSKTRDEQITEAQRLRRLAERIEGTVR